MSPFAWIRSDPSVKLASLVLAIFVWMYVRSEERPMQVFSVPLELEGLPADLAVTGEAIDSVAVRVRALDSTLRNLSPARFHARVQLVNARPGEISVPLTPDIVRAPMGVEVLRVDPPSLALKVERRISREVPVVARFKGQPAPGYEQDGYTLAPDKVMVEGPEGIVRQVGEAVTEEVDIGGRSAGFETVATVVPDRGGVRVLGEAAATITVKIREQRVTRIYPGIRLTPNLPSGVSYLVDFKPAAATVVLEGTKEVLAGIGPDNIKALLDLEGMSPREASYAVKPRIVIFPAELGADVSVHSVSEPTVNVRISRPGR